MVRRPPRSQFLRSSSWMASAWVTGRSCTTRTCTLTRTPSVQSGSSRTGRSIGPSVTLWTSSLDTAGGRTREPTERLPRRTHKFIFPHARICPGRYFADSSLFLNIACVLHLFDISQPVDEAGKSIEVSYTVADDGFAAYDSSFRLSSFLVDSSSYYFQISGSSPL